jgi:PAS domain S-box-containing protein
MSVLDPEKVGRIKMILKWNQRGTTISDLAVRMKMNRNLVAKYLDMLLISGQVEMQVIGAAKVYFLSRRVPVSALLELSSDLVIVLDHDRKIIQMNEPALSLLENRNESPVGKTPEDCKSPVMASIGAIISDKSAAKSGEGITELSGSVQGKERHFRIKRVPTAFEDGTDGITLIIEDVTAQKKYHQMLEISEARYRGLVQSSGEAIIGMTATGRIASWNPAATRLYGYEEPEVLMEPLQKLVPESGRKDLDTILSRVRDGDCIQRQEMRMLSKDGTARDILMTISPIRGEEHEVIGASSVIQDITRKKLEQHIRRQEDHYRTQLEDLNVGFYRSTGDPAGRFVWGNTALLKILGFGTLSDLGSVPVKGIFSRPAGRAELLDELRRSGFVKNRILNLQRPDGTPVKVSVTALAEFNERKDLVFINGIVQDITGEKTGAQ